MLAEDEDAFTACFSTNKETLLHRAVGRGKSIIFVEKLIELMPREALALQNGQGETALSVTARSGNTKAAMILVDKNPSLLQMKTTQDGALDLIQRHPNLATFMKLDNGEYPLKAIARKQSAFPCVPMKLENYPNNPNAGDIENPADNCQVLTQMSGRKNFFISVPHIKHIREKKLRHHQALELVKCLCKGYYSFGDYNVVWEFVTSSFPEAARLGIHEVLQELVGTNPNSVWSCDANQRYTFQIAVINRNENVFNLIYHIGGQKQYITQFRDKSNNTILHLAGKLAPPHKLNLVSGAALQMQRELQWFKEVEKFVIPAYIERENSAKKTPAMIFSEEHKNLVIEGEKWTKDTANSCTIAAALIATIVFAAAISGPGGNNADGFPIFSKNIGSILTSRYAELDFLYSLRKSLIIGLVTLFLSITWMMIIFSATLYLVFGHKKGWILIPGAALA
ncbi:uncharacterized protein LOC132278153 [Cornus florida]|uniref:uncharacterized protein LOC132278153 n=1 Tax=Cornus florida TaxID=4283 RepID=UPI00289C832D|nr:uncharacterized protein LOC132278153 [Cornus florida]